ncbi:inositol monophosphatase [Cephaloticoccus capnophilus]|uniref:Histidinol-phosphatase n=1 Tax=Cephaloticoccus capnophilus TaxID=1548208 RepID=A0A139SLF9_9BACT|nr:histidinol-phosphatase [Cephaloticoccus capnophilus]KXU35391.1 inositol monophosphatase [Cephaloticoccus capnophilus]
MDLSVYRNFLAELAYASGKFLKPYFARGLANDLSALAVEHKADQSPVTEADRDAEALLRQKIKTQFPAHGIIGEEHGTERDGADFVWVLDPIDGTKSFISGVPLWGTLIALLHNGAPILGAIHQPTLGQLLIGDGQSAELNGRRVRTRTTTTLAEATLLTSDTVNLDARMGAARASALLGRARIARTWGDCYGYLLVATGQADAMLDPIMNPWDIAALVPIIRGAGGVISDWTGGAAHRADTTVAAATAELHATLLTALS